MNYHRENHTTVTDDFTDETDPADHRDLLRRVDGSLEGIDRLRSYMKSDTSRARLLAERLEHIAAEMERDDRFPDDPGGYDFL